MSLSSPLQIIMALPLPSKRGFSFLSLLFTLGLTDVLPLLAQDTGTASTGTTSTQDTGAVAFSNYQNTPVSSILDIYEQLCGKHLIRDVNLGQVAPISINATNLSKAEMLKLISATLLLNGVAFVPVDDKTLKVITIGTNKNPRSEAPPIYANAADLPANDQIVSYYMPLSYINAQDTLGIFTQTAPLHSYGSYVPVNSAQALIITENASVIRELIAVKELIDVPSAGVVNEFVQLNRADAEKTAELVNKLLDQGGAAPGGGAPSGVGAGSAVVPPDVGNSAPLLNERNLISGPAKIVADTRANRLLIVTRPVNMPFLKKLITELDQSDIYMVPQRRPLRYVLAEDILPALEASLAQGKEEEDQIKKNQSSSGGHDTAQNQSPVSNSSSGGLGSGGGAAGVSATTPGLQAPRENDVPTVVTIGKTRILADNRSNCVIVFGSPDVTSRVFEMIDQLDRKPLQVYLATVIGQLTVTEGVEFGIDILQKFQHVGQGGIASGLVTPGTNKASSAAVPEPTSLTSALGFPLPTGLTLYGAIGSTLDAYVRALESTSRFKVISRPSVYTTNNKLATILSGSQVPVPSNTTSGFTGTSSQLTTTSSIQYEDVFLKLEIIPLINANHEVTLKIDQTNNTLGSSQVISGNSVPTINTQGINTEITVPDKSTIVIGGLISDNTTRNTSGVPFLSDIPLLGYLFKDTSKTKERDELIIMIQPTVIETDADQIAANEAEKQRTILGHDAVAAAMGSAQAAAASATTPRDTGKAAGVPSGPHGSKSKSNVPAASSAAPDVSNGHLPPDATPVKPTLP